MIKRNGDDPPTVAASGQANGATLAPSDVQQILFAQWKRHIAKQKLQDAAHRGVLNTASPMQPSYSDEINIVSKIGRLRLLWKWNRNK
jgi:hypothetical protein